MSRLSYELYGGYQRNTVKSGRLGENQRCEGVHPIYISCNAYLFIRLSFYRSSWSLQGSWAFQDVFGFSGFGFTIDFAQLFSSGSGIFYVSDEKRKSTV